MLSFSDNFTVKLMIRPESQEMANISSEYTHSFSWIKEES